MPPKNNNNCVFGCKHLPTPGGPHKASDILLAFGFDIRIANNSSNFSLATTILYIFESSECFTLYKNLLIAKLPSDVATSRGVTESEIFNAHDIHSNNLALLES